MLFENIFSLYENVEPARILFLTSPFVALVLYRLLTLTDSGVVSFFKLRIAPLPFLIGALYCVIACTAVYSLGRSAILPCILVIAIYVVMACFTQTSLFLKAWHVALACVRVFGGLLARFPVIFTAIFISVLLLPSLFYGLDVTDGGYHLSQSTLVFHEGLAKAHLTNYLFLTYYFSGAITSLLQYFGIGLWGLRILWMFVFIAPIAISVHLMRRVFGTHWLLPVIGAATAASHSIYTTTLEYETVPSLFAALFFYFLYRTYAGSTATFRPACAAGLGLSFFLLILARVTTAPMLFVFLAPVIFVLHHRNIRRNLVIQIAAFTTAASIFILMLWHGGSLKDFLYYRPQAEHHSITELLDIILKQIHGFLALQTLGILLFLSVIVVLAYHTSRTYLYVVVVGLVVILTAPQLYYEQPEMRFLFPVVLSTITALCALTLHKRRELLIHPFLFPVLCFGAALLPFALGAGSDMGLSKLVSGIWLLLPLSLMLLLDASRKLPCVTTSRNLYALVIILTCILLISGFRTFHRYPYGDFPDRSVMSATFKHPQLKGIHTMPGRKESFEGLLQAVSDYMPKNGDRILAYNNLPMIFYASKTYPLFNYTWITCITLAATIEVADTVCSTADTTPSLIVRTKTEMRSAEWGNYPKGPPIVEDVLKAKSKMAILDRGIKRCNARLVWQNADFQLFLPAPSKK